jgi:dTDP-4-amino-4,6-dideoxygalactose transaminase
VLKAIPRYGARWVPQTPSIIEKCRRQCRLVEGPHIAAFEDTFAARLGGGSASTASRGRMAFYYILKALDLPPGSEIVFPALTFWVVPAMALAAGLTPVFADVNPVTFNLDPESLARAITPATRAVVPTHIYGLPCDMEEILLVARRHGLRVIEDCAHVLGAEYHGQPTGTFGDAAFFSFQLLKPLNTFGGGMTFTRDRVLGLRLREIARQEPWPSETRVLARLRTARLEHALVRPRTFTATLFPILWAASFLQARPDVYIWEKVRPLSPLPGDYRERYANVQAALGLEALSLLDSWTAATLEHARRLTEVLRRLPGVVPAPSPSDRRHVYYQYCAYVPNRDAVVRGCLRRGLDLEFHHMDVCPDLALFTSSRTPAPGARRTNNAVQLPVHAGLSPDEMDAVLRRFRSAVLAGTPALARTGAVPSPTEDVGPWP